MESSQQVQAAKQDERIKQEAERLFRSFWTKILTRNPIGLLAEIEDGKKVFSFESYLRETGKAEYIEAYCSHIKATNYVSNMVSFTKHLWPMRIMGVLKLVLVLSPSFLPGVFLYLLIAAFLATFNISFWGWLPAVLFALTGPVMLAMLFISQARRNRVERKAGNGNVQYIVKNFDNDELTFLRTRNKLFVEGK